MEWRLVPRAVLVGVAASNWVECRWVRSSVFATAGCTVVGRAGQQATGDIDSNSEDWLADGLKMLYYRSHVGDEVEQLKRDRPDSAVVTSRRVQWSLDSLID